MSIFDKSEHSCRITKTTKQTKNNWKCSYMWDTYHFMQFWYRRLISLLKNLRKRTKKTKNTLELIIFLKFDHYSLPPSIPKGNVNSAAQDYETHALDFHQIQYELSFFIRFSTSPCQPWSQSTIKTIQHATTCVIFIILFISNISYSLTWDNPIG